MPADLQLFHIARAKQSDNETLSLNNPSLLAIYLAFKSDWVSRTELAFLFRPDEDEASALKQIRLLLYRAKKLTWTSKLEIETKRVRLSIVTDVQLFKEAIEKQDWLNALELYQGALLDNFSSAELITYNAWLELERSDLESAYLDALLAQSKLFGQDAKHSEAAHLLSLYLSIDALAEEVFQAYLKHLYLSGQRDKALKTFDKFKETLIAEFDAEPLASTQTLVKRIYDQETLELPQVEAKALNTLPNQSTRFIGRKEDLNILNEQLKQTDCRLLSIIGLGGTGKTRLTLELARQQQGQLKDGILFIALAALTSRDALVNACAEALQLNLKPNEDSEKQVLAYLKDKAFLFVFDNFEHLLEEASFLEAMLRQSTQLKLIVSSRERLNVAGEWLFDLEGFRFSKELELEAIKEQDATLLFINSAKRVVPTLSFSDDDYRHIHSISERVAGLPLALELAASWARLMSIERIALELSQSYDLLSSDLNDLPERHRNLNSILEKTWLDLSEKKRQTLASFSVFQGGCSLDAAEAITNANFSLLLSLVNQSLLLRNQEGRFEMHALIQQHAKKNLQQSPEALADSLNKHAAYYQNELIKTQLSMSNISAEKQQRIKQDLANYQSSWQTLNKNHKLQDLGELNQSLFAFFNLSGRFSEGLELFSSVQSKFDTLAADDAVTLGFIKLSESRFLRQLGQIKETQILLQDVLSTAQQHKHTGLLANTSSYLGDCAFELGDYPATQKYFRQAETAYKAINDWRGLARVHNMLGNLAKNQAKYELALTHFNKTLEAANELNDTMTKAIALNNMANISEAQADYEAALKSYLACLAIFEEMQFLKGIAVTKTNAGLVNFKLGKLELAKTLLKESLVIKEQQKDIKSIVLSQVNLADVYLAEENLNKAESYLLLAFESALDKSLTPTLLDCSPTLLKLCHAQHEYPLANKLMQAIKKHPNSNASLNKDLSSYQKTDAKQASTASQALKTLLENLISYLS